MFTHMISHYHVCTHVRPFAYVYTHMHMHIYAYAYIYESYESCLLYMNHVSYIRIMPLIYESCLLHTAGHFNLQPVKGRQDPGTIEYPWLTEPGTFLKILMTQPGVFDLLCRHLAHDRHKLNPKTRTLNLKPYTLNPKPKTLIV